MNNDMNIVELTDEQLESVSGGTWVSHHGVGNVNINIATPVNIDVSPTINLALFSKNVSQSGANANLQNYSWQGIR
jgi:hypothetical protein